VNELHLIVVFSGCLVKRLRHKTPMSPTDLRLFILVYCDSFYFISTSLCVPEDEIKSKYAMFGNLISCGLIIWRLKRNEMRNQPPWCAQQYRQCARNHRKCNVKVKASHEEVQREHLAKSRAYRMLVLRWKNTSEENKHWLYATHQMGLSQGWR